MKNLGRSAIVIAVALVAMAAIVAAQAVGLGTIAQAALARHSGMIRRHFGIADDRRVVCGISFGFADHAQKINSYRTSRASVPETVTFVE